MTGPIIEENRYGTIGDSHVVVPDAFFKAIMAERNGEWHSIAFIMQNRAGNGNLQRCAIPVDGLEAILGIDLFCALGDMEETKAEKEFCLNFWKL